MNGIPNANPNLPSSMKDIVFKHLIKLIEKLKMENNAYYRVMLYTSSGTVVGDLAPCSPENEMLKYTDDPDNFSLDISSLFSSMEKQFVQENPAHQNYSDAYMINVINATVYKNGTRDEIIKLDQLILFTDQIIGFSLVKK